MELVMVVNRESELEEIVVYNWRIVSRMFVVKEL